MAMILMLSGIRGKGVSLDNRLVKVDGETLFMGSNTKRSIEMLLSQNG